MRVAATCSASDPRQRAGAGAPNRIQQCTLLRRISREAVNHGAVCACQFFAKRRRDIFNPLGSVLDAGDQVMRILALETLIERKRLQASDS